MVCRSIVGYLFEKGLGMPYILTNGIFCVLPFGVVSSILGYRLVFELEDVGG